MNPRAIEAGAKAIIAAEYDEEFYPFETSPKADQDLARKQMRNVLAALKAEGFVVVPVEAISYARQMANLCFNYKQSSAFDEKVRRNMDDAQSGFDRAMISAAQEPNDAER